MESKIFELSKIKIDDPKIFQDTFRALLHTIFYHRTLGPLNDLNYTTCKVLKTTYALCGDEEVAKDIENKLKDFVKKLKDSQGKGVFSVVIDFVEKKKEKVLFIETEVDKTLEKWVLPFECVNIKFDDESKEVRNDVCLRGEKILGEAMIKVMEHANENADSFPNIAPSNNPQDKMLPYKYKLAIEDMNKTNYLGLYNLFRK